jgi:hypothetical protein
MLEKSDVLLGTFDEIDQTLVGEWFGQVWEETEKALGDLIAATVVQSRRPTGHQSSGHRLESSHDTRVDCTF